MSAHSHVGHMPTSGKALVISTWLRGIYFVVELALGLWTGLIAVLSDAFHTLSAVGGVLDIYHVHAWTLTSSKHAFSAHLRHDDPSDTARILESAYNRLTHDHGFHMVTLQLETRCLNERHVQDLDIFGKTTAGDNDKKATSAEPNMHHNAALQTKAAET